MPELKSYLPDRLLSAPVEDFLEAFQPPVTALADTFDGIAEKERNRFVRWFPALSIRTVKSSNIRRAILLM